jgi:large subunit ribosomal protein L29
MKAHDLRELNIVELEAKAREVSEEIFHTRMKVTSGEFENTAKLKVDRRDLARIKTLLEEKRRAEAK